MSWRLPERDQLGVTHYTILYASRKAWAAGHWQVLQRDGEEALREEAVALRWEALREEAVALREEAVALRTP